MTQEQNTPRLDYSDGFSEGYTKGWCDSFQNNHEWAKERIAENFMGSGESNEI